MAQNSENNLLAQIHDLIDDTFSLEEFRDLCFRLGVKYDHLRGENLPARIRDLVQMMHRQRRLGDLLNFCARLRPRVEWPDPPNAVNLGAAAVPVTTPARNPRQIFLSHARQDADFAHQLATDLSRHEWDVWIAPDSIGSGEGWVAAINRGLAESGIFLLTLTPDAVNSKWVHSETDVAIGLEHDNSLRFIPLDLKPATVPPLWRRYQWVSFQSEYKAGLEELLQALQPEKMRPLARLYRQLQDAVDRRDWAQVQKLGAEINAQYADYRETETLMAMAKREEAREQRQAAENHAQKEQEEARLQQQQEEARAQKRREELLAQKKQTEAAQLYARLQTAMDAADWDTALTMTDQIETLMPSYRDVKQLTVRARQAQRQEKRGDFSQTVRRIPMWGWIGGVVVIAFALFGVLQLVKGGSNVVPTAIPSPTEMSVSTQIPTTNPSSTLEIETRVRPADGAVMVYVPEGAFMMGSDDGQDDEQPIHEVNLDAYWIDQTEVTNAQFAQFVTATGYETTAEQEGTGFAYVDGSFELIDGADWQNPTGPDSSLDGLDAHPVVQVSWDDASAYCEWADSRLPTEAEWEKAAGWDDAAQEANIYPWGNNFDGTRLNFCDNNCSFEWKDDTVNDGYEDTAPVGSYPDGVSSYGALDMAGNVWEWTADWYDSEYYQNSPAKNPQGSSSGDARVLRGGSWFNVGFLVRAANRSSFAPSNRDLNVGFRCAQE